MPGSADIYDSFNVFNCIIYPIILPRGKLKLTAKMENNEFPKVIQVVVPSGVKFIPPDIHVYTLIFLLPEDKGPNILWLKVN